MSNPPDAEETQALQMEQLVSERWRFSGKGISFWSREDIIADLNEIRRLKKISASYQRRRGYPKDGI